MNRNRVVISIVLIAIIWSNSINTFLNPCCVNDRSRSFMFTRPINQNLALIQAIWHDYIYDKQGSAKASFQIIGSYQESVPSEPTRKYFLFNCKDTIFIAGDATPYVTDRDARAEWFNLPNTFEGFFSVNPKQRQLGIFFEYNQNIDNIIQLDLFKDYWVDITIPLMAIENAMHPAQNILQQGPEGTPPSSLLAVFDQPDWLYGKIGQPHSLLGIAEICIRFGKAYMNENNNQIVYYSGFRLPTAGSQNAEFIFNPMLGNNGHIGVIAGVNFQIVTNYNDCNYAFCIFVNLENTLFVANTQHRTLDLLYNPNYNQASGFPETSIPAHGLSQSPWSRYLLLNKKDGGPNQNIPAVNILTQSVRVHPYGMVDASIGLRLLSRGWDIEVGYNLWAHAHEHIELKHCFPEIYGIAGRKDPNNPLFTTTASKSTIDVLAANDTDFQGNLVFVPIKASDLDMRSGASKDTFTQKGHISIGYGRKGNSFDGFFGAGAWYEVPYKRGALTLYGAWLKIGGSF